MFNPLLGLLLLWYLDNISLDTTSKTLPEIEPQVEPPTTIDPQSDLDIDRGSQEDAGLSELSHAISEYLNQHGGLHTAAQLASALGEPQNQVQQALNQLLEQGQVGIDKGRYGTPDEVQAAHELAEAIVAQLAETAGLDTASELAEALGQPQDHVQSALDDLRAQGVVADWSGRYGPPDKVQALRDLSSSIRTQLAETAGLNTASELAEKLGQPQAQVQQALDELKAQGEVGDWNGRYGTSAEVDQRRQLGDEIVAHLENVDKLQTAAELASVLNQPETRVQQVLDQLQAGGQVGEWDGRYGTPEEVDKHIPVSSACLKLDGVDDGVSVGQQSDVEPQQALTVEAWVNAAKQKQYDGIVSRVFHTGETQSGYGLLLDGSSGIYFTLKTTGGGIEYLSSGANTLPLDSWHHVAGTYDGEHMRVYIDGVEVAAKAQPSSGIDYDPEHDLYIGQYKDNNEIHPLEGQVSEARIWDRALTPEELRTNMNYRLNGAEAGLVGYWPLDEGEGETVHDRSTRGNDGTIHGASWQEETGLELTAAEPASAEASALPVPCVLQFNRGAARNSVEVADPFENNTAFTISLWVKPSVLNDSRYHGFIGKQGDAHRKPSMWVAPDKNSIHYDSYGDNGTRYSQVLEHFFLAVDQWVHIAWVKDGRRYRLYRDGELFADKQAPPRFFTAETAYWIGRVDNYFRGQLAEVRIWSRARSEDEIKTDMNRRLSGTEDGLVAYWPLDEGEGGVIHDLTANANQGTIRGATWSTDTGLELVPRT